MLIGNLGALLSFVSLILSFLAYMYSHDAFEWEAFEIKCLRLVNGLTVVNLAALAIKDYSDLAIVDFVQMAAVAIIAGMCTHLMYLYARFKRMQSRH